jgi:hypothetical protein
LLAALDRGEVAGLVDAALDRSLRRRLAEAFQDELLVQRAREPRAQALEAVLRRAQRVGCRGSA